MISKYCILKPNIYIVKFLILTPVLQLDNTLDLNLHINILNNTPVTAWKTMEGKKIIMEKDNMIEHSRVPRYLFHSWIFS